MEKLAYKIEIDAPAEKVWDILWENETYCEWTKPFADDSNVEGDWEQGGEIRFLDGKGGGMYAIIESLIPNELMSFKHLGGIKDGEKDPFPEESEWHGGVESYRLIESNGLTELVAEVDSVEEYKDFMDEKFPQALARVKELSEELIH